MNLDLADLVEMPPDPFEGVGFAMRRRQPDPDVRRTKVDWARSLVEQAAVDPRARTPFLGLTDGGDDWRCAAERYSRWVTWPATGQPAESEPRTRVNLAHLVVGDSAPESPAPHEISKPVPSSFRSSRYRTGAPRVRCEVERYAVRPPKWMPAALADLFRRAVPVRVRKFGDSANCRRKARRAFRKWVWVGRGLGIERARREGGEIGEQEQ